MSDENKDVMQEENQNILELVDEDGNTVPFEHLDTVQIDGEDYIAVSYTHLWHVSFCVRRFVSRRR